MMSHSILHSVGRFGLAAMLLIALPMGGDASLAADESAPLPVLSEFSESELQSADFHARPSTADAKPLFLSGSERGGFQRRFARRLSAAGESLFSYSTLTDFLQAGEDSRLDDELNSLDRRAGDALFRAAADAVSDEFNRMTAGGFIKQFDVQYASPIGGEGRVSVDALYSLWEGEGRLAFGQFGVAAGDSGNPGAHASWGYRFLSGGVMWGGHFDLDQTNDKRHGEFKRYSAGLEARTGDLDIFLNLYRSLDEPRKSDISGVSHLVYTAEGWDVEAAGRLPGWDAMELGARYYEWERVIGKDLTGASYRASFAPHKLWRLDVEFDDPEEGAAKWEIFFGFKQSLGSDWRLDWGKRRFAAAASPWTQRYASPRRAEQRIITEAIPEDEPPMPSIGFADNSGEVQAGEKLEVTLTLSESSSAPMTVKFEATGAGGDYQILGGAEEANLCEAGECALPLISGATVAAIEIAPAANANAWAVTLSLAEGEGYEIADDNGVFIAQVLPPLAAAAAAGVSGEEGGISGTSADHTAAATVTVKEGDPLTIVINLDDKTDDSRVIDLAAIADIGDAQLEMDFSADECAENGCRLTVAASTDSTTLILTAAMDLDPSGEQLILSISHPLETSAAFADGDSKILAVEIIDRGTVYPGVIYPFGRWANVVWDFGNSPKLPGGGYPTVTATVHGMNYGPDDVDLDRDFSTPNRCESGDRQNNPPTCTNYWWWGDNPGIGKGRRQIVLLDWLSSVSDRKATVNLAPIPGYRLAGTAVTLNIPAFPLLELQAEKLTATVEAEGMLTTLTIYHESRSGWQYEAVSVTFKFSRDGPDEGLSISSGDFDCVVAAGTCIGEMRSSRPAYYAITISMDANGLEFQLPRHQYVTLGVSRAIFHPAEPAVTINFEDADGEIEEGGEDITITVIASPALPADSPIRYSVSGDDADGLDYELEFQNCEETECARRFFSVKAASVAEGGATITISLLPSESNNYALGNPAAFELIILDRPTPTIGFYEPGEIRVDIDFNDNEQTLITLTVSHKTAEPLTVNLGAAGEVSVTLTAPPDRTTLFPCSDKDDLCPIVIDAESTDATFEFFAQNGGSVTLTLADGGNDYVVGTRSLAMLVCFTSTANTVSSPVPPPPGSTMSQDIPAPCSSAAGMSDDTSSSNNDGSARSAGITPQIYAEVSFSGDANMGEHYRISIPGCDADEICPIPIQDGTVNIPIIALPSSEYYSSLAVTITPASEDGMSLDVSISVRR